MNTRSSFVIVVIAACIAIAFATSSAHATSQHRNLACRPKPLDIVCLVQPSLTVKGPTGTVSTVSTSTGRRLPARSKVSTSRQGSADLYLRDHAICRMMAPTPAGTSLQTRRPFTDFLFTQHRGETICTLPDLSVIGVVGSGKLPSARSAQRASSTQRQLFGFPTAPLFNAVLVATSVATQIRVKFVPRKFFAVAVQRGTLLVGLSDYSAPILNPGEEQTIALNGKNRIISSTLNTATFTSTELSVFNDQVKRGGGK